MQFYITVDNALFFVFSAFYLAFVLPFFMFFETSDDCHTSLKFPLYQNMGLKENATDFRI
jgi:hypothetical protein